MILKYPKRVFRAKKDAVRHLKWALDLLYGPNYFYMPAIETATWKRDPGDKGGRWHFTFTGPKAYPS